jgi:prenyltransferase beta subunit
MNENAVSKKILKKAISHIISAQDESGAWSRLKGEFPCETEPTSWAVKVLSNLLIPRNSLQGNYTPLPLRGRGKGEGDKVFIPQILHSLLRGGSLKINVPDRIEKGVRFILSDQQPDGSWNNNAAHTGFAVMALQETAGSDEAIERAKSYLRKVQHEEGGFQRTAGIDEPTTLHTAIVLFAMRETGFGIGDPMVRKALLWLANCQNEDGGYGVSRGMPSVAFGTARAVKALRMFGTPLTEPFVKDGIAWLLKTQKESGGFAMMPDSPEDPEITAYAMTVMNGIDAYKENMKKAITYLEETQEDDGTFKSYAPIQFNNVAKKNTQTVCFVAWALLEMQRAKGGEAVDRES